MEINICRRNRYGYCKYRDHCHFRHEKIICIDSNCNILNCEKDTQKFVIGTNSMEDVNLHHSVSLSMKTMLKLMN